MLYCMEYIREGLDNEGRLRIGYVPFLKDTTDATERNDKNGQTDRKNEEKEPQLTSLSWTRPLLYSHSGHQTHTHPHTHNRRQTPCRDRHLPISTVSLAPSIFHDPEGFLIRDRLWAVAHQRAFRGRRRVWVSHAGFSPWSFNHDCPCIDSLHDYGYRLWL